MADINQGMVLFFVKERRYGRVFLPNSKKVADFVVVAGNESLAANDPIAINREIVAGRFARIARVDATKVASLASFNTSLKINISEVVDIPISFKNWFESFNSVWLEMEPAARLGLYELPTQIVSDE